MEVVDFQAFRSAYSSFFFKLYKPPGRCEHPVSLAAGTAVAYASGVTIRQHWWDAAVSHHLSLHVCMF